ncbi:MAG: hypothetical protein LBS72_01765 [Oscillospiraceae bacterium]|nr:hypothetical protein [Oscillospiraceae bacterium]
MIGFVLIGLAAVAALDIPALLHERDRRANITYIILFAAFFVYATLYSIGREPLGPVELLMHIFRDVFNLRIRDFT